MESVARALLMFFAGVFLAFFRLLVKLLKVIFHGLGVLFKEIVMNVKRLTGKEPEPLRVNTIETIGGTEAWAPPKPEDRVDI